MVNKEMNPESGAVSDGRTDPVPSPSGVSDRTSMVSESMTRTRRVPVVVLVTPREELVIACAEMVRHLREVPAVEVADLVSAPTVILGLEPFAVLISEPVFLTNPDEFESVADSVKADIIVVDPMESATVLVRRHSARLKAMFALWEARGRQSISPP